MKNYPITPPTPNTGTATNPREVVQEIAHTVEVVLQMRNDTAEYAYNAYTYAMEQKDSPDYDLLSDNDKAIWLKVADSILRNLDDIIK